jgi:23S rRNA (guanine745-N1)-methyltransferase
MSQLSKRAESILRMQAFNQFACPHCKQSMNVETDGRLQCENNHSFDVAKQGYVYMLAKPMNSMYSKELFASRHHIITSGLYDQVQQKIAKIITENNVSILDTGCGEGSHLARICAQLENATGVGIDIAKEAIVAAAKYNPNQIWCVGDLAQSPYQPSSFDVVLNFLSPANYEEFSRLLKPNGKVIKVVPQENYLKEIRQLAFAETDKETYSNESTVARFKEHYASVSIERITYTVPLPKEDVVQLLEMTPIGWHLENKEAIALNEITIDLDILIGSNN